MRAHYTDERLAMLLAHAQDGKLAYGSCCCFIGAATADHALETRDLGTSDARHYSTACKLEGSSIAELAYCGLSVNQEMEHRHENDRTRRRILIPMIRAEMRRREREKQHEAAQQPESKPEEIHA